MPHQQTVEAQDDPFDIDVGDEEDDEQDEEDDGEEPEEEGGWQVRRTVSAA